MQRKEKGAVTIFCIIVLFSIVLLGGLFIDASRILLAKQMVRSAMNSAARSALSYYSTEMVGDFGLYGVTEEDAKEQFKRYFVNNLTLSKNDGFNLYTFEIGDDPASVTVSAPLSEETAFVDQVSEYTKYRAGINLTIGVIDKISMLFGENGAGNQVFGAVDDSQKAVDQLKNQASNFGKTVSSALSTTVKTQTDKAKKELLDSLKADGEQALDFGKDAIWNSLTDADDAIQNMNQQKDEYVTTTEQANNAINQADIEGASYWDEASQSWKTEAPSQGETQQADDSSSPKKQAEELLADAQAERDATANRIEANMASIETKADRAQECKQKIADLETEIQNLEEQIGQLEQQEKAAKKVEQAKKDAEDALAKFQRDNDCDLSLTLAQKRERLQNLKEQRLKLREGRLGELDASLPQDADMLDKAIAVQEEEIRLQEAVEQAAQQAQGSSASALQAEIAQKKAERDAKKAEKTAAQEEFDSLLTEIEALYDAMAAPEDTVSGQIECEIQVTEEDKKESDGLLSNTITKLKEFYDNTIGELAKNAYSVDGSGSVTMSTLENQEGGWGLIGDMIDVAKGIIEICADPNRLLENMYMVEYAMDKYTFLTSQSERPSHHFQLGEVEYILKGETYQGLNIGSVLADIMMLRLVINFVDDLIHTQSPEPISRILVALGRALIDTAQDMWDMLFTEDGCRLCPSFNKVKLTYSDHLRLKLLLDTVGANSRTQMKDRMVTMIDRTMDIKKGDHASQLYTRLDATAEVKIDLIMLTLPMFGELMPGQDVIEDGSFTIRETVSMGY